MIGPKLKTADTSMIFELQPEGLKKINEIRRLTGVDTEQQAIAIAIDLAAFILQRLSKGGEIVINNPDDGESARIAG